MITQANMTRMSGMSGISGMSGRSCFISVECGLLLAMDKMYKVIILSIRIAYLYISASWGSPNVTRMYPWGLSEHTIFQFPLTPCLLKYLTLLYGE